ncbi:blastula protease 10-like [Macrobrachium rosenbergii]|uniref:blastula protease 10-like n=1 Tax=Macrobrachium rosenbergii TaxID=79674 RepID=UPI0034D72012
MIANDIQYQGLLGRSKGRLSFYDKKFVNIHYRCISKWLSSCGRTKDPCENGGYTGSDCECVCPPGTAGKSCQNVQGDYYRNKLPSCNQIITEDTVLLSPNHPSKIKAGTTCVYQIKAHEGQIIHLNFTKFHLQQSAPNCLDASLTVFTATDVFTVCAFAEVTNSVSNFVGPVAFLLDVRNAGSKGFQVDVKFKTNGPPTKPALSMAGGTRVSWSILMHFLCPLVAAFLK